ncbi:hypothetical protein [Brevibacillus agri]|uniref:hypothetical protein n=1 Tax=Brevibacillus agri TaxID=51101 RepID=UPI003D752C6D
MAISSVRKGGGSTAKTGNPGVKYWGTNFGKELMMGGKELVLTAKESEEGQIFIKLHEEDGIEIHSDQPIVFSSEKDMEISAENKLEIKAKEAIYLMCSTSSMILEGKIDIQSPKLEVVGLTKAPVVVEDLPQEEEEEEPEEEEEKSGWGSFLDGVQLALDVVGLIPGVGEIADLANAGISLARGDYAGAALSLAACIPFAGWAATGAKLAGKATKALKATKTGSKVLKATEKASDVIKKVTDVSQAAIGKVVTTARKMEEKLGIIEAVKKMKDAIHKRIMAAKEAVMNKAREMKAKVKERARAEVRELPERMQEGMNRLGEVLQPKAVTSEGFVMKASKSEDKVVSGGRTANQKKWDEVYHPGSANNAKVPEGAGKTKSVDKEEGSYSSLRDLMTPEEVARYDEYWYKIGVEKAIKARDAKLEEISTWSNKKKNDITTVVGGVDLNTGNVAVGIKSSKQYAGKPLCAEDLVVEQLGGNHQNIIMTDAIRPRKGNSIPVCKRCQTKFSVKQFIEGTEFE